MTTFILIATTDEELARDVPVAQEQAGEDHDDSFGRICAMCDSPVWQDLGQLGSYHWYRCRACGWEEYE